MAQADQKMIMQYKNAIKKEDATEGETYEKRLSICKSCDFLNAGTCLKCGCYVELRAAGKNSHCPAKKW